MANPKWPEGTPEHRERQRAVGQNGPSGCHYELMRLDKVEHFHEQDLADVRGQRREYINKNNLNPRPEKL